jgi:hypothetical protein
MPSWPSVRGEATRQDVLDEDNARPTLPELVSAPEAAEILGVSPQRVHELASSPGFPSLCTNCGPVGCGWRARSVLTRTDGNVSRDAHARTRQRPELTSAYPNATIAATYAATTPPPAIRTRGSLPSSRPSSASIALVKLSRASAIAGRRRGSQPLPDVLRREGTRGCDRPHRLEEGNNDRTVAAACFDLPSRRGC